MYPQGLWPMWPHAAGDLGSNHVHVFGAKAVLHFFSSPDHHTKVNPRTWPDQGLASRHPRLNRDISESTHIVVQDMLGAWRASCVSRAQYQIVRKPNSKPLGSHKSRMSALPASTNTARVF